MQNSPQHASETAAFNASQPPWPSPTYAWYVVGVLIVAYAFAILDRIAIGLLVQPIQADLGLTDTEMGLLQGAAFGVFYSLFAIPIGYLIDHRSRTKILAIGLSVWSFATILCGFAKGFGTLFAARVSVGVGEASVSPASSSLIADYFPPEKRSKAYGLFMLGSTLGMGMAYLIGAVALELTSSIRSLGIPVLAEARDWQIVFFLIGTPGVFLAFLLLATVKEPIRRDKLIATDSFSLKPIITVLKSNWLPYLTVIGGTVFNLICIYAQLAWQPTLFIRLHGWTASEVSIAFGVAVLPIGVFSAFSAGWLLSYLSKKGRQDSPLLVMLAHAGLLGVFGAGVCLAPTATLAYISFAFVTIGAAWSYAAALSALNQITPNELRGQITGVYTLVTGLVSMGVGAFVVGLLSDTIFAGPNGIAPSLATVNVVCSVVAAIFLLLGTKSFVGAVDRASQWMNKS